MTPDQGRGPLSCPSEQTVPIRTLIKTQSIRELFTAKDLSPKALKSLERAKGFEPSTPTLARFGSKKFCRYIRWLFCPWKIRTRSEHSPRNLLRGPWVQWLRWRRHPKQSRHSECLCSDFETNVKRQVPAQFQTLDLCLAHPKADQVFKQQRYVHLHTVEYLTLRFEP